MRTTLPIVALALLFLTACGAETPREEHPSPDASDAIQGDLEQLSGKADGISFTRPLDPMALQPGAAPVDGFFTPDAYTAFEFTLEEAQNVTVNMNWKTDYLLKNLEQPVDSASEYTFRARTFLFRKDLRTESEDPNALWDLDTLPFKRSTGPGGQEDTYQIQTPGTFLALMLTTKEAYEDKAEFQINLFSDHSIAGALPGHAHLRIFTESRKPAANLRVAISTIEGTTDENGIVLLEEVPAGEFPVKFGPSGNGLALPGSSQSLHVNGNGETRKAVFVISDEKYETWTTPAP